MKYEHRILALILLAGLAGSAMSFFLLCYGDYTIHTQVTLTLLIGFAWIGGIFALQGKIVFSLRTLSNLLGTLREGDYSLRVRTVRHEVNNSLTPIQSVADSLRALIGRSSLADDWQEDLRDGLELIAERAEVLDRFIGAYSRLMHLPQPSFSRVDVGQSSFLLPMKFGGWIRTPYRVLFCSLNVTN